MDASGLKAIGNSGNGIQLENANENILGKKGAENIISGNEKLGIDLTGAKTETKFNKIGVDKNGKALPNKGGTVAFLGNDNIFEGNLIAGGKDGIAGSGNNNTFLENTITGNDLAGIALSAGTGNVISKNSIFNNGGLGIDYNGDGVTPNDANEADGIQNFPVITSAALGGSNLLTIQGTLHSTPNSSFTLEFFQNTPASPEEGETFLTSVIVMTDGNGDASFSVNVSQALSFGSYITATATGDLGTSEFSAAVAVTTSLPVITIAATDPDAAEAGNDPGVFTIYRTGDLSAGITIHLNFSGTATPGVDYGTPPTTIFIPPGVTAVSFTIVPIDDKISEKPETIVCAIAFDAAYVVGSPLDATITIADND